MEPSYYVSGYTAEDGSRRYSVIAQGSPVMAETNDKATALKVLASTAKACRQTVALDAWDGDAGRFVGLDVASGSTF